METLEDTESVARLYPIDDDWNHVVYTSMVVDGIPGSKYNSIGRMTISDGKMFSLKEEDIDGHDVWQSPYVYCDDGYPIDEEHYLFTGHIRTTNPEQLNRKPGGIHC